MPHDVPDAPYLSDLQGLEVRPVFILGLHRSGTSILYKMLAATGCFSAVTAYHLIRYDSILANALAARTQQERDALTAQLRGQGVQDRGIDALAVTADFAEEYGFLLARRTLRLSLSDRNLEVLEELCRKLQVVESSSKPTLLKNPYDFSNFLYLKDRFPEAKFVFIHRHPLKTLSSTLKAWQTLTTSKNAYTAHLSKIYRDWFDNPLFLFPFRMAFSAVPELGVAVLTRNAAKATRYYLDNVPCLPASDWVSVTYEELCMHPRDTVTAIMAALGQPVSAVPDLSPFIRQRTVSIDPNVQRFAPFIQRSMRRYWDAFGYRQDCP